MGSGHRIRGQTRNEGVQPVSVAPKTPRRKARRASSQKRTMIEVFTGWPWPAQVIVVLAAIGALAEAPDPFAVIARVVRALTTWKAV